MLEFKNEDVAAKYISSFKGDPVVHQPGKNATGFKCKLSQVTLAQADKLFEVKNQNLLELKTTAVNLPAKQTPVAKDKEKAIPL